MSPSSSAVPASKAMPAGSRLHSRHNSAAVLPLQEARSSKAASPKPLPVQDKPNVHYTCFIRLPFKRNGFEDPPLVEWDAAKDRALWKWISKTSNSKDLDWEEIAARFDVALPFLLQQAAWLYERHFEGMRKQMQKLGVSQAPSPAPPESGSSSGVAGQTGGLSMQRQGSKGGPDVAQALRWTDADCLQDSRMPTGINTLKGAPSAAGEGSSPGTPRSAHPPISRTPSTTTVTQSRLLTGSGRQPLQRPIRSSSGSQRRPPPPTRPTGGDDDEYALGHDGPSDSGSEDEPPSRSQAFRRAPLGKKPQALRKLSSDGDAEDDEEGSSGGYLPFAATSKAGKDDPAATSKDPPRRQQGAPTQQPPPAATKGRPKYDPPPDSSATSSASSAAHQAPPSSSESAVSNQQDRPPGPISPRHRAQLANASLSPRSRKDGSEGSPSMGSSFSDLDDASVTQSALEDALLSNMQHGNLSSMGSIASRVGRIGDVLRKG
ncbi:hypothetical protein LTR36_005581 [Oleoguttula mirabilis]|uniref:Autophagy-related protein 29 n=1 Tax=Oleoguttula mirabilis TaxID=1507867 RepID=A0AAV9JEH9_9PEZI|nr:hypothetical protein LTR36_005581 [Oleoguttula mirabilis]